MTLFSGIILRAAAFACLLPIGLTGCKATGNDSNGAAAQPLPISAAASAPPQTADDAPPPEKTGGFDGKRAFAHVVKQVGFGPRPSGSQALAHLQDYLQAELKSYGCSVETDSFGADTPVGRLPMKNFLVKIPGEKPGVILLGTHYDTLLKDNFVGADDGGSSTGLMLEFARLLCPRKNALTIWIAFLDGEEAFNVQWKDPDNTYGSRELAARMALSGDLARTKAVLLADMIGSRDLRIKRDTNSTSWLTDMVWSTASRLGYGDFFVSSETAVEDDHVPFLSRKVPSVDIIDLEIPYWHTPQDTLDKLSPRSLAVVGHVLIAVVPQLEQKFARSSSARLP